MANKETIIIVDQIEPKILTIRGHKVMLESHSANRPDAAWFDDSAKRRKTETPYRLSAQFRRHYAVQEKIMKKLSIGSWAYLFKQDQPVTDFHALVHKLMHLGYQGIELYGF